MTAYRWLPFSCLLLAAAITLACGGSSPKLQTVTIAPSTADAKHFPNGQVPFTATGTFNGSQSPTPLTSNQIVWCYGGATSVSNSTTGICAGNVAQFASVDQTGRAQITLTHHNDFPGGRK